MSAEVVEGRSVVPRPVASATPRTFPAVPRLPPVALAGGDLPSEAHSRRAAWEGVPPRRARGTHKQHGGSGGRSSPDSQEEAEMADRWQDDYEREPGRGRAVSKPRKSGVAVRRRGVEKGRKGGRNGEPHERVTSQALCGGLPPPPPDLDCADVPGSVRVGASDPHRLDADDDGIGCDE
jgi:hypothetical protein